MKWVVRNFILSNVVEGIFQSPIRNRIALGQTSADGSILKLIYPRPLKSLPPCPSINHTISIQSLEASLERFHFANLVVLFNVFLPKIELIMSMNKKRFFVKGCFVANRDAFGTEDFGFKAIVFFDFTKELHRFREEVEGIDNHNLGLT